METRTLARWAAVLLVVEALLFFVPLAVLGAAINWPASLDAPASELLPLLVQQADAVRTGYFAYLLYSILFWPVALLVIRTVAGGDTLSPLLRMAAGFGIASAVARTLGIIRWLGPMPVLAQQYVDPAATEATRASINVSYTMLNDYAGSVGEILGVSLFASIWALLVGIAILRSAHMPRWLGLGGLVVAGLLATPLVEIWGIDAGPMIAISVMGLHLWFLALAAVFTFRKGQPVTQSAIA
ncbi:MAG: DUF4386 domain-containing protein [Chloroflexaceae bacterium]|jgi:hypothetical protein|nr:DUF4386 domain-containing protein [Chloroflexaceae bacterium]